MLNLKTTINTKVKTTLGACLLTLFIATPTWADDIEIYTHNPNIENVNPNIVFIIDTSGSMKNVDTGAEKSRLGIVKDVFGNLMDTFSGSGVNIAVMRFDNNGSDNQTSTTSDTNQGGYFISPMQPLNATNKDGIKQSVTDLTHSGYTPLAETLHEAALYYRGDKVKFGNSTKPGTNLDLVVGADFGVLNANDTTRYQSPITSQCQKENYIVMLTDGNPKWDFDADADIHNMAGITSSACNFGKTKNGGDDCLDELAKYLHNNDQSPLLDGTQRVNTYTIGFKTNQTLLSDTAKDGGGEYFTADNADDLTTAFTSILNEITTTADSMVGPSMTVNTFNRLTHIDEVYFALFRPSGTKAWNGNIKGYKMGADPNDPQRVILLDANGNPAITNGDIDDQATSLWTQAADAPDGNIVTKGGAASMMPIVRKVYTYTGTLTGDLATVNTTLSTGTQNILSETNSGINNTMLGLADGADSSALLKWARGVNADDTPRHSIGDPLHSQPVVVTYGGTTDNPQSVLYVSTNQGFLHAIDAQSGVEKFAFIPQALLANLNSLKSNSGLLEHPYGLDGDITTWVNDVDGDGQIESGDHVYLYIGMRRGGNNYYALDVTNPDAPVLKWVIRGGISGSNFAELGQTWSKPTIGKIKLNGSDTDVLIFGGGYDSKEDLDTPPDNHVDTGRAIFIVDANSGQRLWWAGPSSANTVHAGLTHSIPSDISALDINSDGYTDRLYVGDMNAQLFRVDIDNDNNTGADNLATMGTIAQLGGTGVDRRRFFNAPDVALTKQPGYDAYLSISLGSGYRAHPLNTSIQDRFYSVRDYDIFNAPTSYTTLAQANLFDATSNVIGQGTDSEKADAIIDLNTNKKGWFISLGSGGEKVLASSTTFDNQVFFTTYTPQATPTGSCSTLPGIGKAYHVSLLDATPPRNYDINAALTKEDRLVKQLDKGGIPSGPVIAFPKDKQPSVIIGNEALNNIGLEIAIDKTFWTQE